MDRYFVKEKGAGLGYLIDGAGNYLGSVFFETIEDARKAFPSVKSYSEFPKKAEPARASMTDEQFEVIIGVLEPAMKGA